MAIYRDIFGRIINKVYNTIWNKSAIKENFMKNILTFLVVYLQFVFIETEGHCFDSTKSIRRLYLNE